LYLSGKKAALGRRRDRTQKGKEGGKRVSGRKKSLGSNQLQKTVELMADINGSCNNDWRGMFRKRKRHARITIGLINRHPPKRKDGRVKTKGDIQLVTNCRFNNGEK